MIVNGCEVAQALGLNPRICRTITAMSVLLGMAAAAADTCWHGLQGKSHDTRWKLNLMRVVRSDGMETALGWERLVTLFKGESDNHISDAGIY